MRVARAITVLLRRRDWIIDRMASSKCSPESRSWLEEEKRAIETAVPVLEAERDKRQIAVMEQRAASEEERAVEK